MSNLIHLKDNPLPRRPLIPEDIKLPLLGHWGASPINETHGRSSNGVISHAGSRMTVLVVPTHEERMIAREAMRLWRAS